MAQKRMFNKTITNDDNFLEMPISSQVLYFHLSMNADDDGFINNWKSIMRMTGTKDDDLKVLVAKQYIIPFDSDYLVYAVCAEYLADDGNSQTQLQKFSQLRDTRLMQLKAIDNSGITDYNDEICISAVNSWR